MLAATTAGAVRINGLTDTPLVLENDYDSCASVDFA